MDGDYCCRVNGSLGGSWLLLRGCCWLGLDGDEGVRVVLY